MQSLWFLWDIFINVLEFYFSYLLLRKQLGISKGKKRWVVAGTIVLIVLQTLMNYYGVNSRIVMVCMYILGLVYAFFLFNGTPAMRIMWGSAPTIVFIMANLLVYIIVTSINSFNMQAALTPSLFRLFPTSLYISFWFLMFFGMSKFPRSTISLPRNLQWFIMIVILLGTMLAGQLQAFASSPDFTTSEHNLLVMFTISLVLMLLAFFYIIHRIGEAIQKEAETNNKLESAYLEQKNNTQMRDVIRAWNHDQHHFLAVLQSLIGRNDIEGIKQYLGDMSNDLEAVTTMTNTGNTTVDAILENKLHLCKLERIPFKVTAKEVGQFPISDTELTSLIGNLLDNAIEACKACRNKNRDNVFIDFQIIRRRKMIVLSVVNSSGGNYKIEEGRLLTTKRQKGHGYGMRRIRQIVEDANGFYNINPSEDRFKIEIFIPDINADGGEK